VWTTVLDKLGRRGVQIEAIDASTRRRSWKRFRRTPDVWLTTVSERPPDVAEPVVAMLHGVPWPLEEPSVFELVPRAFAEPFIAATEALLDRASLVIVPSDYARLGLERGYGMGPDKVFVVPLGVDAHSFNPERRGGAELAVVEFGRRLPYVLFVSIPSIRQKNLAGLRAAMGELAARGFPHGLVIAGGTAGGETPEELAAIVEEIPGTTGRVAWLGHIDDAQLAGLMAECSAFCLPSLFDSFPLGVLEAMACGAPVVVSDRGGLPALVGDAGLVVDSAPSSIADALERVLTEPGLAARLGAAARARAETMTWERTADGWLEVLTQAARSGR
jgi:glycosyltransferase involved in cell wall biosynthesis